MEDHRQLDWQELSRQLVARNPIFGLWRSRRSAADGRQGEFWLLESADWVNVVAVVDGPAGAPGQPQPCFLMVRQYRHGLKQVTTEFPAGLVEPGESLEAAAARELLEETGYRAGRLRALARFAPNPAFMMNWCTTFLAEELVLVAEPSPDALEVLERRLVPVRELEAAVGTGEYVNSLVMVALSCYSRHQSLQP